MRSLLIPISCTVQWQYLTSFEGVLCLCRSYVPRAERGIWVCLGFELIRERQTDRQTDRQRLCLLFCHNGGTRMHRQRLFLAYEEQEVRLIYLFIFFSRGISKCAGCTIMQGRLILPTTTLWGSFVLLPL